MAFTRLLSRRVLDGCPGTEWDEVAWLLPCRGSGSKARRAPRENEQRPNAAAEATLNLLDGLVPNWQRIAPLVSPCPKATRKVVQLEANPPQPCPFVVSASDAGEQSQLGFSHRATSYPANHKYLTAPAVAWVHPAPALASSSDPPRAHAQLRFAAVDARPQPRGVLRHVAILRLHGGSNSYWASRQR